jgi:acyl carrier protein
VKSVQQRVKACVRELLEIDPEDGVTLTSHFTNDLGADSLDLVELCMCIEDEFGLEIPDEAAERLHTVGDAVTYIERKLAYQAAAPHTHVRDYMHTVDERAARDPAFALALRAELSAAPILCRYCGRTLDEHQRRAFGQVCSSDDCPRHDDAFSHGPASDDPCWTEGTAHPVFQGVALNPNPNPYQVSQPGLSNQPITANPGQFPATATSESIPMTFAKLSLAQAASINLARQHADADTRKMVKKEIFAAVKAAFGIPADDKVKCDCEAEFVGTPTYLVIRNSRTGQPYLAGSPAAPAPRPKLWFRLDADTAVDVLTAHMENDMSDDDLDPCGLDHPGLTTYDNPDLATDSDGDVYIRLNADHFDEQ